MLILTAALILEVYGIVLGVDRCHTKFENTYMVRGPDIRFEYVNSSDACLQACDKEPRCVAASYMKSSGGCWLHETIRNIGHDQDWTLYEMSCGPYSVVGSCERSGLGRVRNGGTWIVPKTYGLLIYKCVVGEQKLIGCDSLRGNGRRMVGNGGKFCAPSGYLYECQILDDYWTMMPVTPYTKCLPEFEFASMVTSEPNK